MKTVTVELYEASYSRMKAAAATAARHDTAMATPRQGMAVCGPHSVCVTLNKSGRVRSTVAEVGGWRVGGNRLDESLHDARNPRAPYVV